MDSAVAVKQLTPRLRKHMPGLLERHGVASTQPRNNGPALFPLSGPELQELAYGPTARNKRRRSRKNNGGLSDGTGGGSVSEAGRTNEAQHRQLQKGRSSPDVHRVVHRPAHPEGALQGKGFPGVGQVGTKATLAAGPSAGTRACHGLVACLDQVQRDLSPQQLTTMDQAELRAALRVLQTADVTVSKLLVDVDTVIQAQPEPVKQQKQERFQQQVKDRPLSQLQQRQEAGGAGACAGLSHGFRASPSSSSNSGQSSSSSGDSCSSDDDASSPQGGKGPAPAAAAASLAGPGAGGGLLECRVCREAVPRHQLGQCNTRFVVCQVCLAGALAQQGLAASKVLLPHCPRVNCLAQGVRLGRRGWHNSGTNVQPHMVVLERGCFTTKYKAYSKQRKRKRVAGAQGQGGVGKKAAC